MRVRPIALAVLLAFLNLPPASTRAAEVPLSTSGGIYTVPVQINGSVVRQFLVDPGAGVVVIPISVLKELVRNGTITDADIVGIGTAELADSSTYLTARVRLRELRIGTIAVRDVTAAVSPALTTPLLGQSFLRRFASVTFDNTRQVLILSETAPAVAQAPATSWGTAAPSYGTVPYSSPYSGGGYPPRSYYYPGYGR